MTQLVFIEDGRPVTDSLIIAESFGKSHKDVLRDIRSLDCSEKFSMRNFAQTPYEHPQNKQTYSKYLITQDGFTFLAMGYTGKVAAQFKERYINEFNRMREQLAKPAPMTHLEVTQAAVQQLVDHNNRLTDVENRLLQIESQAMTPTPSYDRYIYTTTDIAFITKVSIRQLGVLAKSHGLRDTKYSKEFAVKNSNFITHYKYNEAGKTKLIKLAKAWKKKKGKR